MPGDKTIVLLYPGCVEFEIMLAAEFLNERHPVRVATPDGADHRGSNGMTFRADLSYATIQPEEARLILVPGGDPESILPDKTLDDRLVAAARAGAVLGAICAGPLVLAKAGLLKGRRFTHGYRELHREILAPFWAGACFTDALVENDRNVITAKPEAHVDFATELDLATGGDPRRAERRRHFYKGEALPTE